MLKCKLCNGSFRSKYLLNIHFYRFHKRPQYVVQHELHQSPTLSRDRLDPTFVPETPSLVNPRRLGSSCLVLPHLVSFSPEYRPRQNEPRTRHKEGPSRTEHLTPPRTNNLKKSVSQELTSRSSSDGLVSVGEEYNDQRLNDLALFPNGSFHPLFSRSSIEKHLKCNICDTLVIGSAVYDHINGEGHIKALSDLKDVGVAIASARSHFVKTFQVSPEIPITRIHRGVDSKNQRIEEITLVTNGNTNDKNEKNGADPGVGVDSTNRRKEEITLVTDGNTNDKNEKNGANPAVGVDSTNRRKEEITLANDGEINDKNEKNGADPGVGVDSMNRRKEEITLANDGKINDKNEKNGADHGLGVDSTNRRKEETTLATDGDFHDKDGADLDQRKMLDQHAVSKEEPFHCSTIASPDDEINVSHMLVAFICVIVHNFKQGYTIKKLLELVNSVLKLVF
ncbi:uncharacterized protein LOC136026786 [Artemia franciscana]|uniref:uncharacterized protein LOC136026786 n=1 Tax=Artemia franciscana TaxID=6661 RepID=UPI0032DA9170